MALADSPAAILKRETARAKREHWENALWLQLGAAHLPEPTRQYAFHPTRRYRADLAYPPEHLLIEVDGGIWLHKGGHTTGTGYQRDRERDCEAVALGFTVLRVTPAMVESGAALRYVETALKAIWQRKREHLSSAVPVLLDMDGSMQTHHLPTPQRPRRKGAA